jgi:hypothetical protein
MKMPKETKNGLDPTASPSRKKANVPGARLWSGIVLLVLALFWQGGAALAGTVATESGSDTDGSLIEAMKNAASGDTIDFAANVMSIPLQAAAVSDDNDLTLIGRKNGLADALGTLLRGYGIDVAHGTADFDGVRVDSVVLANAIAGLPSPGVTLVGGEGGGGGFASSSRIYR